MSRNDVFDRLFASRLLRPLQPFWQKHREMLLYLFFGGLTTVVSIGSFWVCASALQLNEHIANTVSWLLAVLFAFVTNRLWVFQAPTNGFGAFVKQILKFYGGRLATFAAEEVIILLFITWLGFPDLAVKIAAQVVVLILNYIVSKLFVFKKKNDEE
jgi:putative flippase GtrA